MTPKERNHPLDYERYCREQERDREADSDVADRDYDARVDREMEDRDDDTRMP